MIRYPDDYDPIHEYWEQIRSGEVIVSLKIRKVYEHIVTQMEDEDAHYFYDPQRANHMIEFCENFCHQSKGKDGGQLVRLELWEKAMLATVFGFVDDDGDRKYREALLIVGKKNGKSLLASCVGNYLLMADGEHGPEVYAVATARDQAKIIWTESKRMIKKSPSLAKRTRCLVGEIDYDANDGVFRPLASDVDNLDGLNIHGALMDEIHQWKQGRALYNIIADGTTAREQPLIFITSTAGTIREDLYDEKYEEAERIINGYTDPEGYHDERFIPFIYELDSRSEWTDPNCWRKANPGLGTIKNATALAEKVERAKADPSQVKNLVCKEFNIRETTSEAWLTFEQLDNRDTFDLHFDPDETQRYLIWHHNGTDVRLPYPRYAIGGVDLSYTTDLTAAKALFMVPGCDVIFVLSMYWLPADLIARRVAEDKTPYDKWQERGLLRGTEGTEIDQEAVAQWFVDIQQKMDIWIAWVGYDAWSASRFKGKMLENFGQSVMIPVIQGKKTLSAPMKSLARDLEFKMINYNNNPIDKWCLANTSYEEDRNGNIQPHKSNRTTKRIDGAAALLDAYTVLRDKQDDYLAKIEVSNE